MAELLLADATDLPFAVDLAPAWPPTIEPTIPARVAAVEPEDVPLDGLIATQPSLTLTRIVPPGMPTTWPVVVEHDGRRYIYDGHKRLSKSKNAGAATAKARVVRLPPVTAPETTGYAPDESASRGGPTVSFADWDESKHPRGTGGKFGPGSAPVTAYHGSPHDFEKFDVAKAGTTTDAGQLGHGLYFSTDPNVAAGPTSKVAYTVQVSVQNPLQIDMPQWGASKEALVTSALGISRTSTPKEITAAAVARGHDSVVLDYSPLGYNHQEIAVFHHDAVRIVGKGAPVKRFAETGQGVAWGEGRYPSRALADPPHKGGRLVAEAHIQSSAEVAVQAASDRLVSAAQTEALRLERAGWDPAEIEDALGIFLGELSESDLGRLANQEVNEAFAIGRSAEADDAAADGLVGTAVYSALLDANCCDVCRALDSQEFEIGTDEYDEHMPPNIECDGGDSCRCTYIFILEPEAVA